MLRTNLATRPFYNERLAAVIVAALTVAVALLTLVNVMALLSLSGRTADLRRETAGNDARAAELRRQAERARVSVDPERLSAVAEAAHEANVLIDGRTFSWTELFNRFEATLPPGVRIAGVQPRRDDTGRFVVTIDVVAREVDEVDAFMEALEQRGGFQDVLARREQVDEEGLIDTIVSGIYQPGPVGTPSTAAVAAEEGGPR
jgi:Tfp pilus assembly protein PilN